MRWRRTAGTWLAISLTCLAAWAASLPRPALGNWRSYTPDSAAYVESARSLIAGRGLMTRAYGGCDSTAWIPLRKWPPGFPVLIASVERLGVPALNAGVLISLVSVGLFLCVIAGVCLMMFNVPIAWLLTLVVATSPALVGASGMYWSEGPFVLLVAASLACLMRAQRVVLRCAWWCALAGFLAGLAWGVRYAGIAALVAEAGFLVLMRLALRQKAGGGANLAGWAAGALLAALPFVVRNVRAFGTALPYDMRPSQTTFAANVVDFITSLGTSIGGAAPYMGAWLFYPAIALTLVFGLAGAAAALILLRRRSRGDLRAALLAHPDAVLFGAFICTYVVVLIAAVTRYDVPDAIGTRFLVPIVWAVWLLTTLLWLHAGRRSRFAGLGRPLWIVVLLFAVAQHVHANLWWDRHARRETPGVIASGTGESVRAALAPDEFVFSCEAHVLRMVDVHARQLPRATADARDEVATCIDQPGAAHLWGIVIEDVEEARSGTYGALVQGLATSPGAEPRFERVAGTGGTPVFKFLRE